MIAVGGTNFKLNQSNQDLDVCYNHSFYLAGGFGVFYLQKNKARIFKTPSADSSFGIFGGDTLYSYGKLRRIS